MTETWCPNLKALDAHIVTPKTRTQEMPQAATWSQLQEELERIIARVSSDSETPPAVTSNLIKRLETAKWTAEVLFGFEAADWLFLVVGVALVTVFVAVFVL